MNRFHLIAPRRQLFTRGLSLVLLGFVLVIAQSGLPVLRAQIATDSPLLKRDVRVELEVCLNEQCTGTAPMPISEAMQLELTLWNTRTRTGTAFGRDRYRAPNILLCGDVAFDEWAFGPTRPMEQLYAVDRLTFWPLDHRPFVLARGQSQYVVRLPRRPGSFVLRLDAVTRPSGAAGAGPVAVARPTNRTRVLEVVAVPEFFGVGAGLLGIFEHKGRLGSFLGSPVIVFSKLAQGRSYQLRLPPQLTFARSRKNWIGGVRWASTSDIPSLEVNGL